MFKALGHPKSIGRDAQRGMVMKAALASSFEMREAELLLQFLVVALDHPARLGSPLRKRPLS